jgi:hypothetical protein
VRSGRGAPRLLLNGVESRRGHGKTAAARELRRKVSASGSIRSVDEVLTEV